MEGLHTMNVKQLRAAAKEAGVDDDKIEEARDGDDPKADLIKLIKEQEAAKSKAEAEAAEAAQAKAGHENDPVFEEAVPPTAVVVATEAEISAKIREQEDHLAEMTAQATEAQEKMALVLDQAEEERKQAAKDKAAAEKQALEARRATMDLERATRDLEDARRQSATQQREACCDNASAYLPPTWAFLMLLLLGIAVALVVVLVHSGDDNAAMVDSDDRRFDHLPCDHPENEDCHVWDALPNCDESAGVVQEGTSCAVEYAPGGKLSGLCDKHCGVCQNMLDALQNNGLLGDTSSTSSTSILVSSCAEVIAQGIMSCAANFTRGGNYEGLCNVACGLCEEGQEWECKNDLDCGMGRQCDVDWFNENDCECAEDPHYDDPDAWVFKGTKYTGCEDGFECQGNTYSNNECVRDGTAEGTPWYAYVLYGLAILTCILGLINWLC